LFKNFVRIRDAAKRVAINGLVANGERWATSRENCRQDAETKTTQKEKFSINALLHVPFGVTFPLYPSSIASKLETNVSVNSD